MIHHERLKPPIGDYPPDEWCVIEKNFRPEFTAQMETILALGNGYLGMRGVFEEGKPCVRTARSLTDCMNPGRSFTQRTHLALPALAKQC